MPFRGNPFADIPPDQLTACKAEADAFMNEHRWVRSVEHPYARNKKAQKTHAHLLKTKISVPPYSTFAVPLFGTTAQMFPARWQFAYAPGLSPVRPTVLALSYPGQLVIEVNLVPEFVPRPPPEKIAVAHPEIGGNVAGRVPFGNRFPLPSSFRDKRTGRLGVVASVPL